MISDHYNYFAFTIIALLMIVIIDIFIINFKPIIISSRSKFTKFAIVVVRFSFLLPVRLRRCD